MRRIITFALSLIVWLQPSCVVVGYSNRGGWFVWPGGLGLLVIIIILLLLARRRRQ